MPETVVETPATPIVPDPAAPPAGSLTTGAEAGKSVEGAGSKSKPPEDGAKPPEDGAKPPDEPKPGAPEKYDLKLPDGATLDAGLMAQAEPILRELNLTNEQASKLAGVLAQHQTAQLKAQQAAFDKQLVDWRGAVGADPEIGGPGPVEELKSVKDAQRGLARYGSSALREFLHASGTGSHPEIVRLFAKLGAGIREDDLPGDAPAAPSSKRPEAKFYPGMNP